MQKIVKVIAMLSIFMSVVMLSGCGRILEMPVGAFMEAKEDQTVANDVGQYEVTNFDCSTSETEAQEINLSDLEEGAGGNYIYDSGQLTINHAGNYKLTGKMNGGNIVIRVFEDEVVHLILDDVEIKSFEGPAIYVENAAKAVITAKEGTENVLSDSSMHERELEACIFSNCDLTFNGNGMLAVYGYHGDAVRTKDQLKIVNAKLYVKAKGEGLRGNDGVIMLDSSTEVECEGIGVFSSSNKDMVIVQGGVLKVIAGKNAIAANRCVSIQDSQTDLYSVLETVQCEGIREFDEEQIK